MSVKTTPEQMNFTEYASRVVTHNFCVFVARTACAVYNAIDKLKCSWFVLTKQGDVGQHHLMMLRKSFSETSRNDVLENRHMRLYMAVAYLASIVKINEHRKGKLLNLFGSGFNSGLVYNFDLGWFLWQDKLNSIKTGDDLFKTVALTGVLSRQELTNSMTPVLLNELRLASIKEFHEILRGVAFMQE